jgi:carbon starvation protein CstA
MFQRRLIVAVTIIVAAVLAFVISKLLGASPARLMQVFLYLFIGLLVAAFAWSKYRKK